MDKFDEALALLKKYHKVYGEGIPDLARETKYFLKKHTITDEELKEVLAIVRCEKAVREFISAQIAYKQVKHTSGVDLLGNDYVRFSCIDGYPSPRLTEKGNKRYGQAIVDWEKANGQG